MDRMHIPRIDRTPEIERAARLKDVQDRERAARPVTGGNDLLRLSDTFDYSALARDRLT